MIGVGQLKRLADRKFNCTFQHNDKKHLSETAYRMIVIEK